MANVIMFNMLVKGGSSPPRKGLTSGEGESEDGIRSLGFLAVGSSFLPEEKAWEGRVLGFLCPCQAWALEEYLLPTDIDVGWTLSPLLLRAPGLPG